MEGDGARCRARDAALTLEFSPLRLQETPVKKSPLRLRESPLKVSKLRFLAIKAHRNYMLQFHELINTNTIFVGRRSILHTKTSFFTPGLSDIIFVSV